MKTLNNNNHTANFLASYFLGSNLSQKNLYKSKTSDLIIRKNNENGECNEEVVIIN